MFKVIKCAEDLVVPLVSPKVNLRSLRLVVDDDEDSCYTRYMGLDTISQPRRFYVLNFTGLVVCEFSFHMDVVYFIYSFHTV
jgi:hypothetical protein